MALENYRDLSISGTDLNAGFQFEFYCANCSRKWKSPFKPYRMGQVTGFLSRFSFLLPDSARTASRASGNFADMGSRGAKESALANAMAQAETLYAACSVCRSAYCSDCYDTREGMCQPCVRKQRNQADVEAAQAAEAASQTQSRLSCPNCSAASNGGRFCAECGFDMASTHKSCPNCGVMLPRQSRFCTDCGHGF
jgi:hypothetical protein